MGLTLGLDLGINSIGWAVVDTTNEKSGTIIAMGNRVLPLTVEDKDEFVKGNISTRNAKRTCRRIMRRAYDRYQLRRSNLISILQKHNMMPQGLDKDLGLDKSQYLDQDQRQFCDLSKFELWQLRAKAVTEQVSPTELGRILLHLNQRRGYKSSRSEANLDKQQTEYVAAIQARYQYLQEQGQTIGQHIYAEFTHNPHYRVKNKLFPREAYMAEFDAICAKQRSFYPQLLTAGLIHQLRNEVIYYQRSLKSGKGTVPVCEFEGVYRKSSDGMEYFTGPKVAPKSSPLYQYTRIWEVVNAIALSNKSNEPYAITVSQKHKLVEHLNQNQKLTFKSLLAILKLDARDGWRGHTMLQGGVSGNETACRIKRCLEKETLKIHPELVRFDHKGNLETQPFCKLWHLIYSAEDATLCRKAIRKDFPYVSEEEAERLSRIDFVSSGYGNKSSKMMRKILPYLMQGFTYPEACLKVGYHTSSMSTAELWQEKAVLQSKLWSIPKGSFRQPTVEKIINQMVNVVNALLDKYGRFKQSNVQFARELKQSKEQRNQAYRSLIVRERQSKQLAAALVEMGVQPTYTNLLRFRLYKEISGDDIKFNGMCMYCGQPIGLLELFNETSFDVEHIIPKSLLFDDSQSNKTLAHRHCNADKGNRTAFDFMKETKTPDQFEAYLERINAMYENKLIGKVKRDKLLMSAHNLPNDFLIRQLQESQFVVKKTMDLLHSICSNVHTTNQNITSYLSEVWGWDHICSRQDQRHSAISALVVASTRQSLIDSMNTMNQPGTRLAMKEAVGDRYNTRRSLLENYVYNSRPFSPATVEQQVGNILISYKPGKKTATKGIRRGVIDGARKVVQTDIVIPRGPLSEESVYGKITVVEKAVRSLTQKPIRVNKKGTVELQSASCLRNVYVIRKPISSIGSKQVDSIVDRRVRAIVKDHLEQYGGNEKLAYRDLDNHPVWFNREAGIQIKSVRCYTGLSSVVPVRFNKQGEGEAFVKPGNNHHVAIYLSPTGKLEEHVCTFWHAVQRYKYGIPVVIKNPASVWDTVMQQADAYPELFRERLPQPNLTLKLSFQQNEMFILSLEDHDFDQAMGRGDYAYLSKYLYRVQKLACHDYTFRHHLEVSVDDKNDLESKRESKRLYRFTSLKALLGTNPKPVKVSLVGELFI
ncbi:MAG: type II CRISPR RNA-guided endonuclease Cas9 [Tannerellaceae bacterium]